MTFLCSRMFVLNIVFDIFFYPISAFNLNLVAKWSMKTEALDISDGFLG